MRTIYIRLFVTEKFMLPNNKNIFNFEEKCNSDIFKIKMRYHGYIYVFSI